MAHDVFICHSSKDKPVADAICSVLEQGGVRCWIAPRDVLAGLSYGEAIIEAINGAKIMIVVFSASANASPQIEREIERAVNHNIRIVQFRIEDVVPQKALEYFLSSPHWLDAFTPPLERHLRVLANQVRELLDRGAGAPSPEASTGAATPPPRPAATLPPAAPARRGGPALIASAIVLGAVVIAGAVWLTTHKTSPPAPVAGGATAASAAQAPAPVVAAAGPPVVVGSMPVSASSPSPAAGAAGPQAGGCIVADPTPTPLNIRMAPNGQILGAIGNGAAVRVLERQTVDGKAWALVEPQTAGAKSGWVFSSYLRCG
ncbi:MAG TPA: TIR domain-containing protein [Caulobacteraceae bacterium]|nr:TIR domain-containing protein [Caulobacteraceae bacterium]